MVVGPDYTRGLRPGEEDEVDALLRAAFPGPEEAQLVRDLRASGAMVEELVTPWEDKIGAYAGISRMIAPAGWLCLAPVAVLPEWQDGRLGLGLCDALPRNPYRFGTRLISTLADMFNTPLALRSSLRPADGKPTLVVLGKPSFYARAGFSLDRAARLKGPYPIHNTLIARAGVDVPEETLVYPPAFDGV